jgi:hypothetical protein
VAHTVETSSVGAFYFNAVQPGPYTMTVELAGFKKWSGKFIVEAGQTASIDVSMEVGSVDAVVEVSGAAPVITTVGMEINDVKDALRIRQLPLNGRDVRNLFNLTPGVEGGGVPRVNGMKVGSAEIALDGISLVDRFGGGAPWNALGSATQCGSLPAGLAGGTRSNARREMDLSGFRQSQLDTSIVSESRKEKSGSP